MVMQGDLFPPPPATFQDHGDGGHAWTLGKASVADDDPRVTLQPMSCSRCLGRALVVTGPPDEESRHFWARASDALGVIVACRDPQLGGPWDDPWPPCPGSPPPSFAELMAAKRAAAEGA